MMMPKDIFLEWLDKLGYQANSHFVWNVRRAKSKTLSELLIAWRRDNKCQQELRGLFVNLGGEYKPQEGMETCAANLEYLLENRKDK